MTWNDVTVEQFIEIKDLDIQDLTPLEHALERISIITDKDYFDENEDIINQLLSDFNWIAEMPRVMPNQSFRHLTFGNFIDLEMYCTTSAPIENIDKICATVNGYTNLIDKCNEIRLDSITKHYSTVENYVKYRLNILEKYKGLFEDNEEEEEEELKEKVNNKWSWQRLIYQLANGEITKANEVTDLPHIMVLNWLSMESELKLKR